MGPGVRHLQGALLHGTVLVAYLMRMNLNVAVVQMTSSETNRIDMSPGEKAMVLSSFFWGYWVLQPFFASLGIRGHSVRLLALSNFGSGALSVALPFVAEYTGYKGVIAVRFATGLFQGAIFTNVYTLLGKWAVPQEKDVMICLVCAGAGLGALISTIASGYIGYVYDWPAIFFVTGLVGIFFGVIELFAGSFSPEDSQLMSAQERMFIKASFDKYQERKDNKQKLEVPWREILTSGKVWALFFTLWCYSWSAWTVSTLTPTYINGVLHFDLEDDGILSALPQAATCVVSFSMAYLIPLVKKKTGLSDSFLRPFWNSIGMYSCTIGLVLLAYVPPSTAVTVGLLIATTALPACTLGGYSMTPLDLSPNFVGIIMSLSNSSATSASIFGPLISTYLIKDLGSLEEWRVVFLISAFISFIGGTVFILWGSAKRQPWDEGKKRSQESVP